MVLPKHESTVKLPNFAEQRLPWCYPFGDTEKAPIQNGTAALEDFCMRDSQR